MASFETDETHSNDAFSNLFNDRHRETGSERVKLGTRTAHSGGREFAWLCLCVIDEPSCPST